MHACILLALNKTLIYRMIPFVSHNTREFSSAGAYGSWTPPESPAAPSALYQASWI